MSARFECPHCGSPMRIRSSEATSDLSRRSYYECLNMHCGHKAIGVTELIKSIVPPNFPNPRISLPVEKPADPRDPLRKPDSQPELF